VSTFYGFPGPPTTSPFVGRRPRGAASMRGARAAKLVEVTSLATGPRPLRTSDGQWRDGACAAAARAAPAAQAFARGLCTRACPAQGCGRRRRRCGPPSSLPARRARRRRAATLDALDGRRRRRGLDRPPRRPDRPERTRSTPRPGRLSTAAPSPRRPGLGRGRRRRADAGAAPRADLPRRLRDGRRLRGRASSAAPCPRGAPGARWGEGVVPAASVSASSAPLAGTRRAALDDGRLRERKLRGSRRAGRLQRPVRRPAPPVRRASGVRDLRQRAGALSRRLRRHPGTCGPRPLAPLRGVRLRGRAQGFPTVSPATPGANIYCAAPAAAPPRPTARPAGVLHAPSAAGGHCSTPGSHARGGPSAPPRAPPEVVGAGPAAAKPRLFVLGTARCARLDVRASGAHEGRVGFASASSSLRRCEKEVRGAVDDPRASWAR